MGRAIAVRTDYRSGDVRRIAQRVKNAAQARRLLAIATVLDGAARQEAAKIGGMDRQTLRDWVIRFNEQGPDGLINKVSPGAPGKVTNEHKAFLARLVEDGPIPALDGVVRWRACDLIMRLHQEFGISVSDDTVYRSLKGLGFSHVSARPRAYKQNAEAMEAFKKTSPPAWRMSALVGSLLLVCKTVKQICRLPACSAIVHNCWRCEASSPRWRVNHSIRRDARLFRTVAPCGTSSSS
jgi:transposase